MKRITYYTALCLAILTASSCSKFDNYDAPDQTVKGAVVDVATGKGVQSEVTTTDNALTAGTRIQLNEISYSATAPSQFLGTHEDGTYINTKLFAATYTVIPVGAFVPPAAKTVEVKGGTTEINFSVEPFLNIEWVGEPILNANGTITAKYTLVRGTANATYQDAIGDCVLYLNNTQYLGNTNFTLFTRPAAVDRPLNTTNTVTSPVVPKGRDMYLRVGARIGSRLYNYSTVKVVTVPN
jgi:hypothetical protein